VTALRRRGVLLGGAAAVLVAGASGPARAQGAGAVRIVVPFAPGGGNDVFARQLAKGLGELRRQPVVVENRPGAGGNLGTEQVVRAAADGSTLLLGHTGTVSINPSLYPKLKFDARQDLAPVAMFAASPLVLVVPASSPAKTVAELVALARRRPGTLDFASSGAGTGGHLTGEMFAQKAGAKLTHIPYKGTAPALSDLAGGQVQLMFSVLPPALALVQGGRLRALAVTTPKRLAALPDVPTVAESGVPGLAGFESTLTYGILAPRATPEAVLRALSAQVLHVAATPEFQSRLGVEGAEPLLGDAAAYAARIRQENAQWGAIVQSSGASVD
jgi:tripartite-type tricarboxylate transporter receptor subunit TctC